MIKTYYALTKPGVLYGNAITAAAGFLLASRGDLHLGLFVALCAGTTLVIASACVINNVLDQDIDSKMERTKKREMVVGAVSNRNATIFSVVLGVAGLLILAAWTNILVVVIGLIGWIDYVWLYGMLSKRLSIHGTLVGSISGAMPILAGYVAVTGKIDLGAILVFLVLFLWQMPEFYSIAVYRRDEYKTAGVPVISVVKGIKQTKQQIIGYLIAFTVAVEALTLFGYTKFVYAVVMGGICGYWLYFGIKNFDRLDDDRWGRKMFRISLIALLAFSALISINFILP